ncbi:MAG: hypothetical protein ABID63_14650 [Pseudomonadota bacterium]
MRELGNDVKALIHHIQLNESGWVDRATTKAIKCLLWLNGAPMNVQEIVDDQLQVGLSTLTLETLDKYTSQLIDDGELLFSEGVGFQLPEAEKSHFDVVIEKARVVESSVKHKVVSAAYEAKIETFGEEEERLWRNFHEVFIAPFIKETGAKSYELITGQYVGTENEVLIDNFLKRLPEDSADAYGKMIHALLDEDDQNCRAYGLGLLNNYLFESASRLPNQTIQNVYGSRGRNFKIRFLLDTNFLFSLLKLHSNPSNKSVDNFVSALRKLPNNIQVGMYVLPRTVDEFKQALANYERMASDIRITKNIVDAGIQSSISGIVETYLERCRASGYSITPEDYFSPFHENLAVILKEKGVELLQEQREYANDQRVIDDALDRLAFYKQKYIGQSNKNKSYEQVWHDVVLWYVINDRRPDVCETFFDADWIGVTIDYSLIAFDARKRGRRGVPCMVHPASLVQALQMLIPIDEELEKAVFSLMKMPFIFNEFDIEDEKATRRILGHLSRFENIDDLSVGAIVEILGDRVLKGKIIKVEGQIEELELVKEAVIEHAAKIENARDEAISALEKERFQRQKEIEDRKNKEEALNAAIELEIEERRARQVKIEDLQGQFQGVVDENKRLLSENELGKQSFSLFKNALKPALFSISIMAAVWFFFSSALMSQVGIVATIVVIGIPIPLAVRRIKNVSGNLERAMNETAMGEAITKLDRWFWWFYGSSIFAVFCAYLIDQVKGFWAP